MLDELELLIGKKLANLNSLNPIDKNSQNVVQIPLKQNNNNTYASRKSLKIAQKLGDAKERLTKPRSITPEIKEQSQSQTRKRTISGLAPRWEQLYTLDQFYKSKKQQLKLQLKLERSKENETTFQPDISKSQTKYCDFTMPFQQRNTYWETKKQEQLIQYQKDVQNESQSLCTFKPQVNKNIAQNSVKVSEFNKKGLITYFERIQQANKIKSNQKNLQNGNLELQINMISIKITISNIQQFYFISFLFILYYKFQHNVFLSIPKYTYVQILNFIYKNLAVIVLMQQFQVQKTKQTSAGIPNEQYEFLLSSPFHNVENKGLISNTSRQLESNKISETSIKYLTQTPRGSEYNIQFKVGGVKEIQQQNQTNSINSQVMLITPLSPQSHRENVYIFQSPQSSRIIHQQFSSPQQQQLQFLSPNREQNQINQFYSQNQPHFSRSLSFVQFNLQNSQKIINFTNTTSLQEELKSLKILNTNITQEIQKLESEAFRGQSAQFIKELEDKIKLLSQMNKKLQIDNTQLINVPDKQVLRELILKYQNDRKMAYNQLSLVKTNIQNYKLKSEELNQKLQNNDTKNINNLIQELENTVQTLIIENDRINVQLKNGEKIMSTVLKQKNENEQLKQKLQRFKRDEENVKKKCSKAEKKTNHQVECFQKLQLLQDENKSLKQMIKDSELKEEDLNSLLQKISVIRKDNHRMMKQLNCKL
ncbi:unnamed protein product [Paramecium sonneborni]|uniref:Uncharacterized protein n=1 Tax=Paramecium sonneborni TaxID=65129 RepID=A0A8S1RHY6_9CILI|nr:unnamed protein product [Paramecium sonneborni]